MNEIKLLTVYRQEMHKIQIKNGFTDEQMTSYRQGFMDAIREYERCIAADVQHVVRCKDCKHRKERHYEESGEKPYIKYECKFTKYSMSDDGFCSFGARMGGDTE